ncbi:elongation factor G-like protein [Leptospira levettii]|uniref:elongation factor G-like protein n=1 Tax=Leptospira levettii TaxID=2023178 RepID=UPI000C2AF77D|nr:elongation factor G-like protein [Leptospira levettii]PJZ87632.1 elongation factor G-like protein [Leptospira levettii]PJZ99190.1 elongation factor G-like protein [Leptospira levettii]
MIYRTVGIFAHIDSGKTTLTERILFEAGKISAVGTIEDGNTESDQLQEEIERGISIRTTFHVVPWTTSFGTFEIQLIDTPGHIDFRNQVTDLLPAMETAIVILEAGTVVQSQARLVIEELRKANIPIVFFINKLDRFAEDYLDTLVSLEEILQIPPVLLFQKGKTGWEYFLENEGVFTKTTKEELLACDEESLLTFWREERESSDLPKRILQKGTGEGKLYPVYGGSAKTGEGVSELLDLVLWTNPKEIKPISNSPLFVLSRRTDPQIGRYAVVCPTISLPTERVIEILLSAEATKVVNKIETTIHREGKAKLSLSFLSAETLEEVVALTKGKLGIMRAKEGFQMEPGNPVVYIGGGSHGVSPNHPTSELSPFSVVLEPEISSEKDFWLCRLEELVWEDPGYHLELKADTGQMVLFGRGELHLEIGIRRISEKTEKKLSFSSINIAKLELFKKMSHKVALEHRAFEDQKSSGALIAVLEDTADFSKQIAFEVSLPEEVKHSIETSFMEACLHGFYGEEVCGLRLRVLSYEMPPGDLQTTLTLLKVAILAGVKECFPSNTYLVGPLTEIEVMVDANHLGVVLSDLSRRNAKVVSTYEAVAGKSHLKANASAENLLGFSGALRNMTKGIGISWERTAFTSEFYAVLKE